MAVMVVGSRGGQLVFNILKQLPRDRLYKTVWRSQKWILERFLNNFPLSAKLCDSPVICQYVSGSAATVSITVLLGFLLHNNSRSAALCRNKKPNAHTAENRSTRVSSSHKEWMGQTGNNGFGKCGLFTAEYYTKEKGSIKYHLWEKTLHEASLWVCVCAKIENGHTRRRKIY